jgi:hypothetical protein
MANAMASASPTRTSLPYRPSFRTSLGPLGQSVETRGRPSARAYVRTLGEPSHREDGTNMELLESHWYGFVIKLGSSISHVYNFRDIAKTLVDSGGCVYVTTPALC